jgi:ribulose 1,5-bisphosphate synthetase/thiazole synthase
VTASECGDKTNILISKMQRTRQEKTANTASHVGPPVVIIGAGYAGLTCASMLQKKGVDVLVVEAQNYVGYSDKFGFFNIF